MQRRAAARYYDNVLRCPVLLRCTLIGCLLLVLQLLAFVGAQSARSNDCYPVSMVGVNVVLMLAELLRLAADRFTSANGRLVIR